MTSKQPLDYSQDPKHDSCQLIVRKDAPFNAEPCPVDLVKNYITPEKYFFCRNHGPLPDIQEAEHTILVQGIGCGKPTYFNMKQIKQDYEKTSVMMVMQVCNVFCKLYMDKQTNNETFFFSVCGKMIKRYQLLSCN